MYFHILFSFLIGFNRMHKSLMRPKKWPAKSAIEAQKNGCRNAKVLGIVFQTEDAEFVKGHHSYMTDTNVTSNIFFSVSCKNKAKIKVSNLQLNVLVLCGFKFLLQHIVL